MNENLSAIHIARQLQEKGLLYFSPAVLSALLSIETQEAYQAVARLRHAGLAAEVEKGKYILLGLEPERVLSNPLFVASHLVMPAYISYWSALHFHGFTTQAPQTIFCATTKKKRPVTFAGQNFRYITLKPRKFFGYRRELIGELPVLVADEAKTIVDCLDQPRYAGGIAEIAQTLRQALSVLDLELLVDYARQMRDKSLASRLGYLLELCGHHVEGLPVSDSPVALEPSRPRLGKLNSKWHIVVNISVDELMAEGIR